VVRIRKDFRDRMTIQPCLALVQLVRVTRLRLDRWQLLGRILLFSATVWATLPANQQPDKSGVNPY